MNPIIELLYKTRYNYVHAIEVNDVFELQSVLENIAESFTAEGFETDDIKDFILTLEIYCLDEQYETEVYDFNAAKFVEELV